MKATKDAALNELDALIAQGQRLNASYRNETTAHHTMILVSTLPESDFHAFATAARASISRVTGEDSAYYKALPSEMPGCMSRMVLTHSVVPVISGALTALRNAVDADLLVSLENRLRVNVYDDFLVQADELLKAGYHVAAMVLAGGVLEDHVKKLCLARSLAWKGDGSLSKYNDLLRDHPTAYDTSTWRRIQALGDDRNKAAHGEGAKIKSDDVNDHLKYVRRILADYPA